jgi:hypothetical protein
MIYVIKEGDEEGGEGGKVCYGGEGGG